jgi:hypothetical protein
MVEKLAALLVGHDESLDLALRSFVIPARFLKKLRTLLRRPLKGGVKHTVDVLPTLGRHVAVSLRLKLGEGYCTILTPLARALNSSSQQRNP